MIIFKYQDGGEINDPRGAKAINEGNQRKAKGLFKGMISGQIMPTMGNIGSMIGAAYKGWVDPESPYNTGSPPILPSAPAGSVLGSRGLINFVNNPAERAARADYLRSLRSLSTVSSEAKLEMKQIAGSSKITSGVTEDWMYPAKTLKKYGISPRLKVRTTPVQTMPNPVQTPKVTTKKIYRRTSKLEDYLAGINKGTKSKFNNALTMEVGDGRIMNAGYRGVLRGRRELAEQLIRKDPTYNPMYEKLVIKREKAAPQNKAEWDKKIRELLKEYIRKRGLY